MPELIHDLALSILVAWILGVAAHLARQPLILAYLVAGLVVGPSGLRWVQSQQSINTIAELGLIFMLFMIGLEIDLKKIRQAGSVILVTSAAQIFGCFALGLALFLLIGIPLGDRRFDALYLAAAASLSSTVIIVKVLYDKYELDTLPGRITLGILVAQDLTAILFLAIQPSLNDLQFAVALESVIRVVALLAVALLISRYTLPHLFQLIAHLPELVLVGALAWCFAMAEFAELLGLSRVMGALIAGVSLSTFPYALDVTAKVTSLRDFFITLFFVALGMNIPVPTTAVLTLALMMVAFTWVSRFITVVPPLYLLRQGLRASLLPAINLAQISEFSLVLLQIGVQSGHTTPGVAGAASTAFVVLAVLNTFLMMRSDAATRFAIPILKRLGLRDLDDGNAGSRPGDRSSGRILILGFYRIASSFLAELEQQHSPLAKQVTVVDFNPDVFHALQQRGFGVHYNDISNVESLMHAGIDEAEIVISSVPDSLLKGITNEKLVRHVRTVNPAAKIIATAEVLADAQQLYAAGADYVTIARLDQASELIEVVTAAEAGILDELRAKLDARLRDRREILP
jgi:Kef-type K+ transport system membrane component KefB